MSSIRDFGAKGDGQTDDSDAFQHAIDKGNGEVILPRGEYRITRTIVIPLDRSDRIGIRGTGTARVIMSAAGPAFHLVGTHDKTALPTDFRDVVWQKERMPHLSDFEIVGGNAMADGIRIEGVMQPTLRGLLIRKCRHGIHLVKRNRNVLIADCHIYDNTGVGIFLDALNLHQININSNHISYCRQAGILVKNGEIRNIQIVGNDIEYNYVADREDCADVYFDAREGTIREGAIVGNTIQAKESRGGANVRLRGIGPSSPNAVGMLSISGNLIGSQETALHLQACRGVTITGNSIYSGYRQSVIAEDSEAIVFSGNVVDDNPDYKGPSTDALRFVRCRNLSINGTVIEHTKKAVEPIEATLLFDGCKQVQLTGCQVINGRTNAVLLRDCANVNISGCTFMGANGDATYQSPLKFEKENTGVLVANCMLSKGGEGEWVMPKGVGIANGNIVLG